MCMKSIATPYVQYARCTLIPPCACKPDEEWHVELIDGKYDKQVLHMKRKIKGHRNNFDLLLITRD